MEKRRIFSNENKCEAIQVAIGADLSIKPQFGREFVIQVRLMAVWHGATSETVFLHSVVARSMRPMSIKSFCELMGL